MILQFCIQGGIAVDRDTGRTWLDPDGNPVPKLKKTKGQQWTPEAKRYVAWKEHVMATFLDALEPFPPFQRKAALRIARKLKPIDLRGCRAKMGLFFVWKNGAHPDPENVFGSIADSLFQDDKRLAGSFDFADEPRGSGETAVELDIPDECLWDEPEHVVASHPRPVGKGKKAVGEWQKSGLFNKK